MNSKINHDKETNSKSGQILKNPTYRPGCPQTFKKITLQTLKLSRGPGGGREEEAHSPLSTGIYWREEEMYVCQHFILMIVIMK